MAIQGISTLGLKTSNVQLAADFYAGVLGGEVTNRREEPDRRVWVRLGGMTLEIAEVSPWVAISDEARRQLPILGLRVDPAELNEILDRLVAARVPHHGPVLKLAGESVGVYLADSDGNGLSLSVASGYPIAGLERRNPNWAPAPYAWSGLGTTVRPNFQRT